jgi:hypothetical protein
LPSEQHSCFAHLYLAAKNTEIVFKSITKIYQGVLTCSGIVYANPRCYGECGRCKSKLLDKSDGYVGMPRTWVEQVYTIVSRAAQASVDGEPLSCVLVLLIEASCSTRAAEGGLSRPPSFPCQLAGTTSLITLTLLTLSYLAMLAAKRRNQQLEDDAGAASADEVSSIMFTDVKQYSDSDDEGSVGMAGEYSSDTPQHGSVQVWRSHQLSDMYAAAWQACACCQTHSFHAPCWQALIRWPCPVSTCAV